MLDMADESESSEGSISFATIGTVVWRSKVQMEMDVYFAEPCINRITDSLTWWLDNAWRFPLLSGLAKRYLAPPPSSVASERLFSTAGDVLTDNRSRLLPEKAEQLIFLKVNMPLLGL